MILSQHGERLLSREETKINGGARVNRNGYNKKEEFSGNLGKRLRMIFEARINSSFEHCYELFHV